MPRAQTVTGGREATTGVIPGRWALSVGNPETPPPRGFRWVALRDVARLESGHTPSRRVPEYWGGDVPWIGIRDATENHGRKLFSTRENVSNLGIANSSARVLPADTVCLSRTASVGYVVMTGRPMATSQDFVNWVSGPDMVPRYLMYVLMAEQPSIRRFAHGTTHQTMYYPEAKALHVCLPGKREQAAIAEVLGALDDKIECNAATRKALRALGCALFDEALARGWTEAAVGDLTVSLARGIAPKYTEPGVGVLVLNQKCIRDGWASVEAARWMHDVVMPDMKKARRHDIVVNSTGVGTLGRVARWISFRAIAVDGHVTVARPGAMYPPVVVGYAMLAAQPRVEALGEGSTGQTELSRVRLAELPVDIPTPAAASRIAESLEALDDEAEALLNESRELAVLRDTLLPRLLSGELRVRDAKELVGEAV